MKNINFTKAILVTATVLLCATAANARATWCTYKNMYYKLDTVNNTAQLYSVYQDTTKIYVAGSFKVGDYSYTITSIAPYAASRKGHDSSLTTYDPTVFTYIYCGSKVTEIGEYAFAGCSNATNCSLPSTIVTIGQGALKGCSSVTSLGSMTTSSLKSLESIGDSAFYGCSAAKTFTINSAVTSIGKDAFKGCDVMKIIWANSVIPESYFYTESEGYKNPFEGITSVQFGNCTTVPKGFMYGNTSLTAISFGSYVTTIGDYAFYNCPAVTSAASKTLTIGSKVTTIGKYAFAGDTAVRALSIPSVVTSIDEGAFEGLDNAVTVSAKSTDPATTYANLPFGKSQTDAVYKAVLSVPLGSEQAYVEAAGTKWFTNQLALAYTNKNGGFAALQLGEPYHYRFSNQLAGVKAIDNMLLMKDNNVYINKDVIDSTQQQVYPYLSDITSKTDYDQSTWILVTNVTNASNYVDKYITVSNGGVVGTPLDTINPVLKYVPNLTFLASSTNNYAYTPYDTLVIGGDRTYELNTYIPANFVQQSQYFFVQPKPMELAEIKWALYKGNNTFVMPDKGTAVDDVTDVNPLSLQGQFGVYTGLLSDSQTFVENNIYSFKGVVLKADDPTISAMLLGNTATKLSETSDYVVAALEITKVTEGENTGVTDVNSAKTVQSVRYYNVAGQMSDAPQDGVNIVVTKFTDGTTATSKVIK